ncbi:cadmium resistance transporter [Actinokineospora cianjurensis]|uniref:Cadmium resistance protein CadD (Predicted permease) n=1 Tax=Actinokineospora cianjurensis TaxID=585224 RepID=A0A421B4B7_9PSEU|nr:cadmium resistance transporter [Actinokineospora cianjurensis]RLK59209.1 cadmium resistance protein CadD (predicted permease) [Actinokineospora cianjurensis]
MDLALVGRAVLMFAVTNVDDIVLLALFFGRGGRRSAVVVGQYLGFAAILAASVAAGLGAGLLPDHLIPLLGLLPLGLGLRAAWSAWKNNDDEPSVRTSPGALAVAGVTLANGGDNVGVYAPVFAASGPSDTVAYAAVFLVLVAAWCAAGLFVASRPVVARTLTRWGHVLLPVVLIGIGVLILLGI